MERMHFASPDTERAETGRLEEVAVETRESISELRGVLVVAREEGAQSGGILGIFVDLEQKKLAGLTFRQGQFGKEQYVGINDVLQLGRDVVSITTEMASGPLPEGPLGRNLKAVQGLWVTTLDGKHLGALVDVDVSQGDWTISEFTLTGNKSLAVDAADITIGDDEILVPTIYAVKVETLTEDKPGFLGRVFGAESIGDVGKAVSRAMKRQRAEDGDATTSTETSEDRAEDSEQDKSA